MEEGHTLEAYIPRTIPPAPHKKNPTRTGGDVKRTCEGCRAKERSVRGLSYLCSLGYKTESVTVNKEWLLFSIKPAEECPKPKTYSDYIYLKNIGKEAP
jgi:hypothetical protein